MSDRGRSRVRVRTTWEAATGIGAAATTGGRYLSVIGGESGERIFSGIAGDVMKGIAEMLALAAGIAEMLALAAAGAGTDSLLDFETT